MILESFRLTYLSAIYSCCKMLPAGGRRGDSWAGHTVLCSVSHLRGSHGPELLSGTEDTDHYSETCRVSFPPLPKWFLELQICAAVLINYSRAGHVPSQP